MKNSKNLSLFGRTGKLQRLFLIALFSVLAIGAYAQSKTVSGTVVDQTGEPIIGANVVVKVLLTELSLTWTAGLLFPTYRIKVLSQFLS